MKMRINKTKTYLQFTFKQRSLIGFTLPEVLITLIIIGVIAALTIPTMIQNAQDRETVAQLKKTYSTLSGAYSKAVQEEGGTPDSWGVTTTTTMINKFKPYLNVRKDCSASGATGCFKDNEIVKYLNQTDWMILDDIGNSLLLSDGQSINVFAVDSTPCIANRGSTPSLNSVCGRLVVDINGFKKPNALGLDTFVFYITKYGIVPRGTALDTNAPFTGTGCLESNGNLGFGGGCAGWVLQNENLDYQKCPDKVKTGWNGPTSCD